MSTSMRRARSPELETLEARMGELASLLAEVADALTSYPESIRILDGADADAGVSDPTTVALRAAEWPSIQEIEQLLSNWRQLQELSDKSSGARL